MLTRKQHVDLAECLLKVARFPEFAPLRQWLEDEIVECRQVLDNSNDDRAMHVAQGGVRVLVKLQKLLKGAEEAVEQYRSVDRLTTGTPSLHGSAGRAGTKGY